MLIQLESPDQAEVIALVEALDAWQRPLYPAASHHGIDIPALCDPKVLFAVARDEHGIAVGCGAIVLEADHGEIKRMYTAPSQRGQGVARKMLEFLESEAHNRGCGRFLLETGNRQTGALSLYARCGYRRCGPFGAYVEDPVSIFMCKETV